MTGLDDRSSRRSTVDVDVSGFICALERPYVYRCSPICRLSSNYVWLGNICKVGEDESCIARDDYS